MPITDLLEQNCQKYGDDIALVELNPDIKENRRVTWKEYELIEPNTLCHYRREITWNVFNEKANRFANMLISRGIKKGDKVAILLMNCLEWLPIYFGILKTGALAVPLNFRYTSEEINYWVGFTAQEMWLKFHPELSDEQRNTAGRRIGKYMMEALRTGRGRLYEGVRETLEALHQDYELVFLSNCMSDYASVHREIFGLDRWIDRYFCTGDYGFKPKEEVFEKYIREPGRQYIAVGDRMKDRRLAESCRLPFIGCLYGFGTGEELQPADALIESVAEMKSAADRIIRKQPPLLT